MGFTAARFISWKKCHERPHLCQTYYCLVTAALRALLYQPCCLHSKLATRTVLEKATSLINTGSLESLRIRPFPWTSTDVTVRKTQLLLLLSLSSSPSSKNGLFYVIIIQGDRKIAQPKFKKSNRTEFEYTIQQPCFFLSCKANARVKDALFLIFVLFCVFLCCSMYFRVVLCIVCFVSFSVLFVCICVLYYCHRVATKLQLNISYYNQRRLHFWKKDMLVEARF
jgi:hypothetical protein